MVRMGEIAAPNPFFVDAADFYGPFTNEEFVGEGPAFVIVVCFCVCCHCSRAVEMAAANLLFVNTADFYGHFMSENFVGKCIAKHGRSAFTVAAKAACEASLNRLGVECIDLFYLHRVDRSLPIEETFEEFKEEEEEEEEEEEADVIPVARELGIGIAYSPLGRGMLTGTLKDGSSMRPDDMRMKVVPRFQGENLEKAKTWRSYLLVTAPVDSRIATTILALRTSGNFDSLMPLDMFFVPILSMGLNRAPPNTYRPSLNLKLVEALEAEASAIGVTTSQLALAWVHSRGDDVFPIPGTKRIKYLEQMPERGVFPIRGTKHIKYLEQNIAAVAVAKSLSPELLQRLELLFRPGLISGDRYDAASACLAKNGGLEQGLE
eukprot:gene25296-10950_t